MNKTILVASLLALSSLSSIAAAADDNWFVRGDVGQSRLSVGGGSDTATTGGVSGGYYFNPNFGAELRYENFGSDNSGGINGKVSGWGAGLVARKDFGPNDTGFFIDGRAGVMRVTSKASAFGGSVSNTSTKGYVGVGAGYDFSRNFGLSVNYAYTGVDFLGAGGHVSTVTAAAEARF